jgi:DNA gyrase inhibitor GyrI
LQAARLDTTHGHGVGGQFMVTVFSSHVSSVKLERCRCDICVKTDGKQTSETH